MRYVAKIHVMDVMADVVVSGYVFDADPVTDPDHTPLEFCFTSKGKGLDDPLAWLVWHVYEALQAQKHPAGRGPLPGAPLSGEITVSGVADT